MFERYTEKARRTICFARYEALRMGAPAIDAEHLLLGLLREEASVLNRLPSAHVSLPSVRRQVEQHTPFHHMGAPVAVEIPLSVEARRVLRRAAEEAGALSQSTVKPEHLLLGLLREEGSLCAQVLWESGVEYAAVRKELEADVGG